MPRKETASHGRARAGGSSSYRASLGMLAFLVACLTALLLITLETSSLSPLLHTLRNAPSTLSQEDVKRLSPLILGPLLTSVLAYLAGKAIIRLVRIQTYRRHLHGYLKQWLHTYAPLSILGVTPDIATARAVAPVRPGPRVRLAELVGAHATVVLTGASGSGKTVALHALAYELSRKRTLLGLWLGRAPLPVLLTVGSSTIEGNEDDSLLAMVHDSLHHFGTRGLAAQVGALVTRSKIAILCDGLDDVPAAHRSHVLRRCAETAQAGRGVTIIVTTDAEASDEISDGWQRITLAPLQDGQIQAALRKSRARSTSTRSITTAPAILAPSLSSPGTLAELLRLANTDPSWPASPAALSWMYAEQALERSGALVSTESEKLVMLTGAVAAGLRAADHHCIPTAPNSSLGRIVAEWIERAAPPTPAESIGNEPPLLLPEELEIACQVAKQCGILAQDAGKHMLRFANRGLEATFAARWLGATDTGLGQLRTELVQARWIYPMLLWAGAADDPGDVALRLLRRLDAPGSAPDTFPSEEHFHAAILALAIGAASVSLAPLVERELAVGEPSPHVFALVEKQLRDILDRVFRYVEAPEQEEALRAALATLFVEGGEETLACLRYLATQPRIPRLVRAQLAVVLGLMRTEESVAIVVSLLDDPDAVLRQAVERALTLAGAAAMPALRRALSSSSERVRARAAEALANIGDTAVDTVIAGLDGPRPAQRAAAAQTLGTLKAVRGEGVLTERLNRDSADEVRIASALALGQIASEQAVVALEQSVASASSADVRAAIAQALGATRHPQALGALLNLLSDAEPQVRAAAAAALGVLGDQRAVPALLELRDDRDLWTQNAVMHSLRRLGS